MEEEIDLRQYVEVLLKYKFWIVGLALLAALVAFVVALLRTPVYRGEASLAMLRVRSEVAIEPKFQTLSEEELQPRTDAKTRRETLTALAQSPVVAAAVLEQMGERLSGSAESVEALDKKVRTKNEGDLILIQASAHDARLVADLANVWAEQAEKYINEIYGQPAQQIEELESQFSEAWSRYEVAQEDLETFLAQNQIPGLERKIAHLQELIDAYQGALTNNEAAIYDEALQSDYQILSNYYIELIHIEEVLVDAKALLAELQRTGDASATEWAQALAYIHIQNRAFSKGGYELQVVLGDIAPVVESRDLEQLITVLEEKAAAIRLGIEDKEKDLMDVDSVIELFGSEGVLYQHIQLLTQELVTLQSELEAEQSRERELVQVRDLTWEIYETVSRKLAEAQVAEQVPGSEVRFAAPALEPEHPMPRGGLMKAVVAGLLGLIVGVLGAFVLNWWQQPAMAVSQPKLRADNKGD